MAKIRIIRDKGWTDKLRKYKIFLNNKEMGTLKQGEELNFNIEPGTHEIYGKVDWCKTKKIKFEIVKSEEERQFSIYSNLRGRNIILTSVYSIWGIFTPDVWIKIEEI